MVGTFCIFPSIGNNHPNWLSDFSEVLKPPTSFYWWYEWNIHGDTVGSLWWPNTSENLSTYGMMRAITINAHHVRCLEAGFTRLGFTMGIELVNNISPDDVHFIPVYSCFFPTYFIAMFYKPTNITFEETTLYLRRILFGEVVFFWGMECPTLKTNYYYSQYNIIVSPAKWSTVIVDFPYIYIYMTNWPKSKDCPKNLRFRSFRPLLWRPAHPSIWKTESHLRQGDRRQVKAHWRGSHADLVRNYSKWFAARQAQSWRM